MQLHQNVHLLSIVGQDGSQAVGFLACYLFCQLELKKNILGLICISMVWENQVFIIILNPSIWINVFTKQSTFKTDIWSLMFIPKCTPKKVKFKVNVEVHSGETCKNFKHSQNVPKRFNILENGWFRTYPQGCQIQFFAEYFSQKPLETGRCSDFCF